MPSQREAHLGEVHLLVDAHYEQPEFDSIRPAERRMRAASVSRILWQGGLTTKRNANGLHETIPLYVHVVNELWEHLQFMPAHAKFDLVTRVVTMFYSCAGAGVAASTEKTQGGRSLTELMLMRLKSSTAPEKPPEQPKKEQVCFYGRCPGIKTCHAGTGRCTMGP
jgi:hypothetical protein